MSTKRINSVKIKRFLKIPIKDKVLFFETFTYLCFASFLLKTQSFKKIAAKMGKQMSETSLIGNEKERTVAVKVGKSIKKLSLYTPFRSLCFEQALALKFMLNRRNIDSTIYFGIAKKEENLKAHAWTRYGDIFLTGKKGKENFNVISTFGSK